MKNYFLNEYSNTQDDLDIFSFLKKKYDEADCIFEKRFENLENNKNQKVHELNTLISKINARIYSENWNNKNKSFLSKMVSLVLGNAYLRLAQCQNEILVKSQENYSKALSYIGEHINHSQLDEIDLLLMLNQGKYYRNTAEVGKKSDYAKALSIFNDVATNVEKINISNEKKFHLLLDAKINVGRVTRYSYDFNNAQRIFLSLILVLESYIDEKIKKQLHNCKNLDLLLKKSPLDANVKEYIQNIKKEEISSYIGEYLLQSLIHIGIIYRKEKNYEDAKIIFELIKHIDENGEGNIDAQNNLGVCYRKLGYLKGRDTQAGQTYYKKAEKIFTDLKNKGNKFAFINLYKCKLSCNESECEKIIESLEKAKELKNSYHLQMILGEFYIKAKKYQKAIKQFENVYKKNSHISRGSLGLKAYYKLAQCKICTKEFRQSRKILGEIIDILKKNHNYTDILTQIDYGWCLIQEGNYEKAKNIYENLLNLPKEKINNKHYLMINNNLADCFIHLGDFENAQIYIDKVLDNEENNSTAIYFSGVVLLNLLLKNKSSDYKNAFGFFDKLTCKKIDGIEITSGWLISSILLYKHNMSDKLKEKITKKIQYTSDAISMKSYIYVSDFVLKILEENNRKCPNYNDLYRDFCNIKLIDCGENISFQSLKNDVGFNCFKEKDRAFILAHIVQMYKYILNIKNAHRINFSIPDFKVPYHYTKLSTLNYLLTEKNKKVSKLRLWNSSYMNDAYEGKLFDELLNHIKNSENDIIDNLDILEDEKINCDNSNLEINSNVYITSFSTEKNSFQMWSIYGDNEKGVAIKFDNDFFDIGNEYNDVVMDSKSDEYALYAVKYIDMKNLKNESELEENLKGLLKHLSFIQEKIDILQSEKIRTQNEDIHFENAITKVKTFIADRINEIRFLFKTKSYEYEKELRLICCSYHPKIDNENFDIPRLYIDVKRKIENIDIIIGSKLENQQIKDLYVWLKNTGKIKEIEISNINKLYTRNLITDPGGVI